MASPPGIAPSPISFIGLGNIVLQVGDNDQLRRWGGETHPAQEQQPVADMQRALVAAGAYTATVDGDFGTGTRDALRRFQWYVAHCRQRLRIPAGGRIADATFEDYARNMTVAVTGDCGSNMAAELAVWNGAFVTTPLVRVPMARFTNISRSDTFTTLPYPDATDDEVLANEGFVTGLDSLNSAAAGAGVQLHLNQTYRRQDVPPSGAVVPPATRSQHLIGHAADLNIVDGAEVVSSTMFLNNTATRAAVALVQAAKRTGLRWGGDFSPRDPVHFDRQVVSESEDYTMNFFFCQHCFALGHPIRSLA